MEADNDYDGGTGTTSIVKTQIILTEPFSKNPNCDHGPTVLFARNGQKYYGCSAYRSRKLCPFYLEETKWMRCQEQEHDSDEQVASKKIAVDHSFQASHSKRRKEDDDDTQISKFRKTATATATLSFPDKPERTHNKGQAQYLFSSKSLEFFANLLQVLQFRNVICVGVPTLHTMIMNQNNRPQGNKHETGTQTTSFLLDIDKQFENLSNFSHYNMCNHHFFRSNEKVNYLQFLEACHDQPLAIICDPPFGARLELILNSVQSIQHDWENAIGIRTTNICVSSPKVFLVHPYFSEGKILKIDSSLKMCDYKIEYDTHKKFKNGAKSPVRLFTNIPLDKITFPTTEAFDEQEYKYCALCDKFVFIVSDHCSICNYCNSKDGKPYRHCKKCNCCVKQTWTHCSRCNACHFPGNNCKIRPAEGLCRGKTSKHDTVKNNKISAKHHSFSSKKRKIK